MSNEITSQEEELLACYSSGLDLRDPIRYDGMPVELLTMVCHMKDRLIDLLDKRVQAAREVIDMTAKAVGINPDNTGFWLYSPDSDGSTPIVAKMDDYFSRSGEKAKLKKRVDELENENRILRSLLQK